MCGIIGATQGGEKAVRTALATFAYRGPDASCYFATPEVALGHARLSIIDLDVRSNQPFFDQANEIGIVFNGEIYNFRALRDELKRVHGSQFRTESDTEVLVEGYRAWGPELLPKLRGMFAFGIYDLRDHSIFLARDHAGIKPLYYSAEEDRIFFASELKGVVELMRENDEHPEIDQEAIALFPVFGYMPTPFTPVRQVRKLERGTWLRYRLRTSKVETGSWRPETRDIGSVEDLQEAVRRSILEHTISDVPVGAFFSGGVDSSLIAAVLHAEGQDLETFSIRVSGRTADEPYFKEIAKYLGVKANIADFGVKEFDALYDEVFGRMDDPIADTSIFPTALVARVASERVKVVLSGEGGDELFLGYPRLLPLVGMNQSADYRDLISSVFLATPSFRGKNALASRVAKVLQLPEFYYLLQVSAARDLSPQKAWSQSEKMLSQGESRWFDRDWYLENMLLRKTDMATMYASIEGRVPLLGVELWNSASRFAAENVSNGSGKAVLKDLLADYIPRDLIDRPKSGFGISIETILRESSRLRDDVTTALRTAELLGLGVGPALEEQIVNRYPVFAFSLVALHYSLLNLNLIYGN